MRLATRLSVLVIAIALVACTGDDGPEPPPLAQRFVSESDFPGSQIDPVETRETAKGVDDVVTTFRQFMTDADPEEMTSVLEKAGVVQAGTEVRFKGEEHSGEVPHAFSTFWELGSEDGATSTLEFLATDTQKPCPESCATVVSEFDVPGIANARGVNRLTTAEAIEAAGLPNQIPRDVYWIAFPVGSSVYSVEYAGPPGTVTKDEALEIATAYHDRLAGDGA